MKQIILLLFSVITFTSLGQTNFIWEKSDTTSKSKNEIYSFTKEFIAKKSKYTQSIIQDDDKEGGIIITKGYAIYKVSSGLGGYSYIYSYTYTFKMRDGKYKLELKDVYCESASYTSSGYGMPPKIQPFEGEPIQKTEISIEKAMLLMIDLKRDLQKLFDDYSAEIIIYKNNSDW
jgi:hypothetical protein